MKKTSPRTVADRDEKYMALAFAYAGLSKDPSTQVGAVIISGDNRPLGWGYNGPPANIDDDEMDWSRPAKYAYIIHAERNAIRYSGLDNLTDCTIYVTAKPCPPCMLELVAYKIKRVCYFPYHKIKMNTDKDSSLCDEHDLSDQIAKDGDVDLEEFDCSISSIHWMRDWMMLLEERGVFSLKEGG